MKKVILLALVMNCFLCYAQSSLDIIKGINENTYRSLKEPATENKEFNDLKNDLGVFDKNAGELRDYINEQFKEFDNSKYAIDSNNNKKIIDLEIENSKLKKEIADLEYGISKRDEEILPLKVRYNLCSKIIYYGMIMGYTEGELELFFSKEELAMCRELFKEWQRRYR